jgi:hypothetical protein
VFSHFRAAASNQSPLCHKKSTAVKEMEMMGGRGEGEKEVNTEDYMIGEKGKKGI